MKHLQYRCLAVRKAVMNTGRPQWTIELLPTMTSSSQGQWTLITEDPVLAGLFEPGHSYSCSLSLS